MNFFTKLESFESYSGNKTKSVVNRKLNVGSIVIIMNCFQLFPINNTYLIISIYSTASQWSLMVSVNRNTKKIEKQIGCTGKYQKQMRKEYKNSNKTFIRADMDIRDISRIWDRASYNKYQITGSFWRRCWIYFFPIVTQRKQQFKQKTLTKWNIFFRQVLHISRMTIYWNKIYFSIPGLTSCNINQELIHDFF